MREYRVLNLKCSGCATTLKEKLRDEFGEVDVNLEVTPRVITIKKDNIDEMKLKEVLKSIGYPVADESMGFIEDIGVKARSFISCASGKVKNI